MKPFSRNKLFRSFKMQISYVNSKFNSLETESHFPETGYLPGGVVRFLFWDKAVFMPRVNFELSYIGCISFRFYERRT